MISFLKNKTIYFIVAGILVIGGVAVLAYYNSQNPNNSVELQPAPTQQQPQTVQATGYLQPATSVNLSFQASGEIKKVYTDVGQRVKQGDVLAALINDSQKASLAQSKGVLAEAQAALNLELAQATDQDIAIAKSAVSQAVANQSKAQVDYNNSLTDLDNTKKTVAQDINSAQIDLQNAELNLQTVQFNGSNSTQQSGTALSNDTLLDKTDLGQLLVSSQSLLESIDKVFGIQGSSAFSSSQYSTMSTSIPEFTTGLQIYLKTLQTYKTLQGQFNALSSSPDPNSLAQLDQSVTDFINNLNQTNSDVTNILSDTAVVLPTANTASVQSNITAAAVAFTTNSTFYETAAKQLDNDMINNGNTLNVSPLNTQSAQLLVTQKTEALTKAQVDGQTQISNGQTAVNSAQATLQVANSAVDQANAELSKVLASPRAVDIAPFKARVTQAQAAVDKTQSDYNNTFIFAPFDGVITARNIDPGDQVLAANGVGNAAPELGLIDDSQFHIEVDIPETQIAQITTDSTTTVTFDAIPGTTFQAKILSIEPDSTTIQNIIYYKAKIALVHSDPRLKSGMTANVTIQANAQTLTNSV